MESLTTAPEASSFVPIAEHQSRTPSSFYSGPPVLHYHSQRCKVVILESDLIANPALNSLRGENATANGNSAQANEDGESTEVAIEGVDTWVGSDKFVLYSPSASAGVSIPYPSISLHAVQRLRVPGTDTEVQGLYMQIAIPTPPSADDEEECVILTVVPTDETPAAQHTDTPPELDTSDETESPTQQLYNAVSACSNLHPDPVEPGDEDDEENGVAKFMTAEEYGNGDLPPPVAGSSGWITAENMNEFFDEEGNWIAEGEPPAFPLGPGAGTVHEREDNGGDENGEENDESKWRRTD
ncbi:uncharacterized protein N7484_003059 [Penicillium longicatenatum]|uniref:uncharacterized protein n=1 Tax=Penicillium longicatenatum TaxID=1561947 RepID=UPI002547800D|nr:uncharacterized protein N7484_003059 [Penicillium longicatenatum]KAJ5649336.1 hypothetical protein N7484_003059 [Penicillium longicatenatum]